jgi:hypothetical protein
MITIVFSPRKKKKKKKKQNKKKKGGYCIKTKKQNIIPRLVFPQKNLISLLRQRPKLIV